MDKKSLTGDVVDFKEWLNEVVPNGISSKVWIEIDTKIMEIVKNFCEREFLGGK
jgi:hypothetical protein